MADFRAIGAVSATLRQVLTLFLDDTVPVTIAPLDVSPSNVSGRRLNLFLYRMAESAFLKNQDLPGRGSPGAYGHPPLSLDLYYLLTAHGVSDEDEVEAQQLLGDGMRVFRDNAIIGGALLDPVLQNEFERLRICLDPVSLDEITKIWSAITRPFRLSAAYKVTVVQIESNAPRDFGRIVADLPAGGPRVAVVPMAMPQITHVRLRRNTDPAGTERLVAYGRIGDTLILRGSNFARGSQVLLGTVDATGGATIRPDRVEVLIPDNADLQPGPVTVRLQTEVPLGDPPVAHRGISSNTGVFVLVPRITTVAIDGADVRIDGNRLFRPGAANVTLIGDTLIQGADYTLSGQAQIRFPVPALATGTYAVRVRVNNIESIDAETLDIP